MSNLGAESEEIDLADVKSKIKSLGEIVVNDAANRRLPLTAVAIAAKCTERAATVTVKQSFVNDTVDNLEVVYIFPLSCGASVIKCEMTIGGRKIAGVVKERAQARADYQAAIANQHRASLIEQERDDVFTVTVGNIKPAETIDIEFAYVEYLPLYTDGTTALRLPTVVAPRYVPGNAAQGVDGHGVECDTDLVKDASRISPPRLLPGFDPKVSLSIDVEIDTATKGISNLSCSQHAVKTSFGSAVKVALSHNNELMDRDFVLIWQLGAVDTSGVGLVQDDDSESYGLVSIYPPSLDESEIYTQPRDVIFLVDRSGSMNGSKMASAAKACTILLNTLSPRDRFAICAFDDGREWFDIKHPLAGNFIVKRKASLIAADNDGIAGGEMFLRTINAVGGTEMYAALEEATAVFKVRKASASKRLPIIVLITDGEVADEERILKHVQTQIGSGRIFCVGIDTAVNSGLLTRLAVLGGGTSALVSPGDALEQALVNIGREIGVPLVTGLRLDLSSQGDTVTVAPTRQQDLFEGRPATFMFAIKNRKKDSGPVKVVGQFADGKSFEQVLTLSLVQDPALAKLYCRARINDLEDEMRLGPVKGEYAKNQIVELAVKHQMLTKHTSYVVVDTAEKVGNEDLRTVVQPVHQPDQWQDAGFGAAPAMPALPGVAMWGASQASQASAGGDYGSYRAFNSGPAPSQARSSAPAPGASGAAGGGWGGPVPPPVPQSPPAAQQSTYGSLPVAPRPPIAPGSPGGGGGNEGGIFEAIGGWFKKKSESSESTQDRGTVLPADMMPTLEQIIALLAKAKDSGSLDDAELSSLESKKDKLFALLNQVDSVAVAKLQAFLRGSLTNLIEALRKKISQDRFKPLLQKCLTEAREAKSKLEQIS